MPDIEITCAECGNTFPFTEREQEYYQERNLTHPKRCKPCRDARRSNFGGPKGAGGERQCVELVEQHPLHLVGQRGSGLRMDAGDLRAQLAAARGQRHHRRERERGGARAGKEQRELHPQAHRLTIAGRGHEHKEADVRQGSVRVG